MTKAPTILLIETSTEVCSVALSIGNSLIDQKTSRDPRAHAGIISIITQELLTNNKITLEMCDAIAVSEGPGSYTGLRVGVSFAKGLCYGASKPLIAVSSLTLLASLAYTAIAQNKIEACTIVPMIDARRMEVYTACYSATPERNALAKTLSPMKALALVKALTPVEALIIDENSFATTLQEGLVVFCGNGSTKVADVIKHPNATFINIEALAQGMIPNAVEKYYNQEFEDVAYFEPFYLKDFIAGISKKNPLQIPIKK